MAEKRPKIIGKSKGLREVLGRAARVARTTTTVLIQGESGTGKELLARHVHDNSERASGPFVPVNCAAIPKDLLESELFGHERGAFTGALAVKVGAFERAHGGTLFLDEIGDMALEHQAKVLRAIQESEVQRVGGSTPKKIDVRIVAATHRDLRALAAEGPFRDDLYYRLAGYELRLPPLRERGRDIIAIAKALLARVAPKKFFSRSAQALLLAYTWPGNIRELENVVRAAAIDARGRRIGEAVLLANPAIAHAKHVAVASPADERLGALRAFLREHGRITPADLRALLHVRKTRAHLLLADWERRGEIVRHGAGRGTFYVAADQPGTVAEQQIPSRQQLALRMAALRGALTRQQYETEANVSARTAKRDLAELVERGALVLEGTGKKATYKLAVPGPGPGEPGPG